jgi:HEAT repeat protein
MDPVKDFFADLRSPDPSIRFSVLSRIEDLAWTDDQITEFKKMIFQETNPGIRFHMQKILARLQKTGRYKATASEIEALLSQPDRDEIALALMLESVKKSDALLVAMALRNANWPSFSQQLLPSVLKFLKKSGSFEDASEIEQLCRHHDPRVLSAAVEALEKISPERLKDLIVPLLVNPNFGIRSRAVRILHRWDPNEALRHFEYMLFSDSTSEKQAALFHSFFFPFEDIELLLLKFIGMENDPELIYKAGLIFRANPTRHSPSRLLEARQASAGEKFNQINNILNGVLDSLCMAGIVKATPEQMLEMLENHFKQKQAKLIIERYSLGLKSGDAEVRFKSAIKLCDLVRHGIVEAKELLKNFLGKEKDQRVKTKIQEYLNSLFPQTHSQKQEQKTKSYADLTSDERINYLNSLSADEFKKFEKKLQDIFYKVDVDEKVAIIKLIQRHGDTDCIIFLQNCLKSDNPEVLTGTIEALTSIEPDSLIPYLPQLIKNNNDEVRLAALRVFSLFDKKQALSLVEKMLESVKPDQRKKAIFCLGQFDFLSIRQSLVKAFKTEAVPENIEQISSLLISNSDSSLFFQVYAEWKSCKTSKTDDWENLTKKICTALVESDKSEFTSSHQLYKLAQQKVDEEEKKQAERASYKLEKIQKIRENKDKGFKVDPDLVKFGVFAYSIGAILTALIWFLFLAPPSTPIKKYKSIQAKKRAAAIKSPKPIIVRGKVLEIIDNNAGLIIQNSLRKGQRVKIYLVGKLKNIPKTGEEFQAQIKPTNSDKKLLEGELITAF